MKQQGQYWHIEETTARFGTGTGEMIIGRVAPDESTHQAVWLPTGALLDEPVYARGLCRRIVEAVSANRRPTGIISIRDEGQRDG